MYMYMYTSIICTCIYAIKSYVHECMIVLNMHVLVLYKVPKGWGGGVSFSDFTSIDKGFRSLHERLLYLYYLFV